MSLANNEAVNYHDLVAEVSANRLMWKEGNDPGGNFVGSERDEIWTAAWVNSYLNMGGTYPWGLQAAEMMQYGLIIQHRSLQLPPTGGSVSASLDPEWAVESNFMRASHTGFASFQHSQFGRFWEIERSGSGIVDQRTTGVGVAQITNVSPPFRPGSYRVRCRWNKSGHNHGNPTPWSNWVFVGTF